MMNLLKLFDSYGQSSMQSWKDVFINGFAPLMGDDELIALRDALVDDSDELIQGGTTSPPPLMCVHDWPVEKACGIAYAGWKAKGLHVVCDVEEYFANACFEAEELLCQRGASQWFLNWFDDTPRDEMRRVLIPVINGILDSRVN